MRSGGAYALDDGATTSLCCVWCPSFVVRRRTARTSRRAPRCVDGRRVLERGFHDKVFPRRGAAGHLLEGGRPSGCVDDCFEVLALRFFVVVVCGDGLLLVLPCSTWRTAPFPSSTVSNILCCAARFRADCFFLAIATACILTFRGTARKHIWAWRDGHASKTDEIDGVFVAGQDLSRRSWVGVSSALRELRSCCNSKHVKKDRIKKKKREDGLAVARGTF